jgi:hypothetical protein
MNKARLISLMISLSLLAMYFQGFARGLHFLGHGGSFFDGH